eukprot:998019-Pyramimonas_sp.AAC.1
MAVARFLAHAIWRVVPGVVGVSPHPLSANAPGEQTYISPSLSTGVLTGTYSSLAHLHRTPTPLFHWY